MSFGTVTVDATFTTIGYRWDVLADIPLARIETTYRETAPNVGAWKAGNPARLIDRRSRGFYRAITGAVFPLLQGRTYEVVVKALDAADAVIGATTFSATMRAENIALPSDVSSAATHAVMVTGSDANPGTLALPWRTLTKAIQSAPSGAIVRVGPGHFQRGPKRTAALGPITFVAQSGVVNTINGTTFDVALRAPNVRSYVYAFMTAPAASTLADDLPVAGGWTQVTLGNGYVVWSRDLGVQDVQVLAWRRAETTDYAAEKALKLRRLPVMVSQTGGPGTPVTIGTPERWAQMLFENASGVRYGLYQPPGSTVAYCVLQGNADPNESWTFYSQGSGTSPLADAGFNLEAPDCRVSGFVFRGQIGVRLNGTADRAIVSHCVGDSGRTLVHFNTNSSSGVTVDDVVVQDCLARGTSVVNDGEYPEPALPWRAVKVGLIDPATNDYYILDNGVKGGKPLGNMESSAISWRKGVRRAVIRRVYVQGYFNGFGGTADQPSDINNVDVIDCFSRYIADNCWEPEGEVENVRFLRCRAEWSNTAGASSLDGGPIYLQDSIGYRCTNKLLSPYRTSVPDDTGTAGAVAWKWGSSAPGVVIQDRCTFWSDQTRLRVTEMMDGYRKDSGGSATVWVDSGVIVRVTGRVLEETSQVRELTNCVEAGQSDPTLAAQIDAGFTNPTAGDLAPVTGSVCEGKGARNHLAPVAALTYA
jgi:hypothetical protein